MGKIKCYISSALVFWIIYHVTNTCPLNKPLPLELESSDAVCVHSHHVYTYVKPYTGKAAEVYSQSPLKPYVDQSLEVLEQKYVEYAEPYVNEYLPVVEQHVANAYTMLSAKAAQLKQRWDDDGLSNAKIVVPDEDNLEAFIGTPNPHQEKTVEPVVPDDDALEPTPEPTADASNVVEETADSALESPTPQLDYTEEEVVQETGAPEADDAEPVEDSKFQEYVEEVKEFVENVVAEEVIEAAEKIGENL